MYEFVGANLTTLMEMGIALAVIIGFALYGRKLKKQKKTGLLSKKPNQTEET